MRFTFCIVFLACFFVSLSQEIDFKNEGKPPKYVDLEGFEFNGDWYMMIGSDPQYPFPPKSLKEASSEEKQLYSKVSMAGSVLAVEKVKEWSRAKLAGLILNGDLTNNGSEAYMEVYKNIYKGLPVRLYPGLGNHDFNKEDENAIRSIQYIAKTVNDLKIPTYSPDNEEVFIDKLREGIRGEEGSDNSNWVRIFDGVPYDNPAASFDYQLEQKVKRVNGVPIPQYNISGSLAYSWEVGNIHFVQMNNHPLYVHSASVGSALRASLAAPLNWLYGDLKQARERGKQVILNWHMMCDGDDCHFPLPLKGDLQSGAVLDADQRDELNGVVADVFNQFDALAIFVGHEHRAFGVTSQQIKHKGDSVLNAPVFKSGAIFNQNLFLLEFFEEEGRFVVHKLKYEMKLFDGSLPTKPAVRVLYDKENPYHIQYKDQ